VLIAVVALAAGVGAVCRYLVDLAVARDDFPWSTLLINTSGSFLLGLLAGAGSEVGAVLGTGFAGGFTTLSTWAWQTIALAESDRRRAALLYLLLSFGLGLAAAAVGLGVAP
jgi:CrcB protein